MHRPHEYPLVWPENWPRATSRIKSLFRTELNNAIKNVRSEMALFAKDSNRKITDIVISSSVTLGTDVPQDPGVAVWFLWDNDWLCFPVDRYVTPKENLQAIARSIAADREKLRHCGINFVRGSFRAYQVLALPKPSWRGVLQFGEAEILTRAKIEVRFKNLAAAHHPDRGGNADRFSEIVDAVTRGRLEFP